MEKITKEKLYKNALDLYKIKDELEQHFPKKNNELFEIQDKIILFDLTNYDYVCVSRSKIKDYSIKDGEILHRIKTQNKEEIRLQRVHSSEQTDYILRLKSPGKKLKEDAIRTQFEIRFEEDPRALLD